MALALTCDCGARFEVDASLAGQAVPCPECQHPHTAPATGAAAPRTSRLALGSLVLALTGAFTVIGTLAAAALGAAALVRIGRSGGRLGGVGFAASGLAAGLVLTAVTLFAWRSGEVFGFGALVREWTLAGQVDTTGPLDVKGACGTLVRPSERWGRVKGQRSDDPAVSGIQKDRDVVLLDVQRYAYVDAAKVGGMGASGLEEALAEELASAPTVDDDDDPFEGRRRQPVRERATLLSRRDLPPLNGLVGRELILEARRGGQTWKFLVRLWHTREGEHVGPVWVVRGYCPARRFASNEADLRQAVESFESGGALSDGESPPAKTSRRGAGAAAA